MIYFQELARVVTGYKLRQIEIITRPLKGDVSDNRFKVVYHALKEGRVNSLEEVAQLLELEIESRAFRRFLVEFRKRFFAPLLFLDTASSPNFNDTQKANFRCQRQLALFKTLLHRNCPENARLLAENTFELALQNDVTFAALEFATYLKQYYVERQLNVEKHLHYKALVEQLRFNWEAENLALGYYEAVSVPYVTKKAVQPELLFVSEDYLQALEPYRHCDTLMFISAYYATKYTGEMHRFEWNTANSTCEEALQRLQAKSCVSPRLVRVFQSYNVLSLCMIDEFEEALVLSWDIVKSEVAGTRNWFIFLDNLFLMALKGNKFKDADQAACMMFQHDNFKAMSESIQESWNLQTAYLILAKKLQPDAQIAESEVFLGFRLNKFMNNVPNYTKDKKGLNVPILIAQFLFLLLENNYDLAQEKLAALRKYRVKHFSTEGGSYRTLLFIRALCVMAGTRLSKTIFIKKSTPILNVLKSVPKSNPDQHFQIEIIPYEVLWSWVFNLLD
jgi:hypothetical protein